MNNFKSFNHFFNNKLSPLRLEVGTMATRFKQGKLKDSDFENWEVKFQQFLSLKNELWELCDFIQVNNYQRVINDEGFIFELSTFDEISSFLDYSKRFNVKIYSLKFTR